MCGELVQKPQESPQKLQSEHWIPEKNILFALHEVDTQLKYDSRLVQGMFLHALDTGLKQGPWL